MKPYKTPPLADPLTELRTLRELAESMMHAHAKYERARQKFVYQGQICRKHINVMKVAGTLRTQTVAVNNGLTGDNTASPKFLYDIAALGLRFAEEKAKAAAKPEAQ